MNITASNTHIPYTQAATSRTDSEIRKSYNEQITQKYENEFKEKFASFHKNQQCFGEPLAREAFEARHMIKEAHQQETTWYGNIAIGLHNIYKYGSWNNPDYDYFIRQGKTPEDIAYSAFKTDGSDLGLENNGFGETLKIWAALRDSQTIYPEDISNTSATCFKEATKGKLDKVGLTKYAEQCLPAQGFSPQPTLSIKA